MILDRCRDTFLDRPMALVRDNSLPPAIDTPFDAEPTPASIAEAPPAPRAAQSRSSMLGGPAAAHSQ
jgi:hypothetical protein